MAASNKKFNLTELLNQRSKEIAPQGQRETEEEKTAAATTADIYDLIPSTDNFYSTADVQDLKQSIELLGVLQPLLVTDEEDGKRRIIAGHRRRLAVMQLVDEGKERFRYVPIVTKPKKGELLDRLALIMANRFREKTDWEKMTEALETEKLVLELKEQMDIPGRTRDLLSEIVNASPAQLGRYKAIYNNLTPEIMAEFKAGKIGVSTAYEVSGFEEKEQQEAYKILLERDTLALKDVKALKRRQEETEAPQDTPQAPQTDGNGEDEEIHAETEESTAAGAEEATGDYIDPQPEEMTSLCYSCTNYETCHDKKATVKNCNAYNDRREAYKTDEQRYNEEQAAIDRETRRKLREHEQEERQAAGPAEKQHEEIRLAKSRLEEIISGALTFLLLKKDGYKVGEELTLPEYADGKKTGRDINIKICYIWEDWTGLDDDYCIIGFNLIAYSPLEKLAEAAGA